MPCFDGGAYDPPVNEQLRAKCDKLTRMLCEVMGKVSADIPRGHFSDEVWDWWREHREFDSKRAKKPKRKRR